MQDWLRATLLPFEVEENMADMKDVELGKFFFCNAILFKCFVFSLLYLKNSFFPLFATLK